MRLVQHVDWAAVAPPVALAVAAVGALLTDLFATTRLRASAVLAVSGAGTLVALGWDGWLAAAGTRATFCLPAGRLPVHAAGAAAGAAVGPTCSYVADPYAVFFQVLVLAALSVVLLLVRGSLAVDRLPPGETCFLLLASVTGMLTLAASRDLVSLVVSLEVVSLPAFVLVGLRRGDSRSASAAVTFFVISVVSTALSLYGMAMLYGVTGTLSLSRIALALSALHAGPASAAGSVATAAIVLVVAGFVFKVAAVPFHAWAPDTYQGSPVAVAAVLSVASKAAGFAGLVVLLEGAFPAYAEVWGPVVAVVAAVTMTVGNLAALRQWHVVRLLAWSTVAQGGYLLVPLGIAASSAGRHGAGPRHAVQATLAYLGIYAAANLGAFAVVAVVAARSPRRSLDDYRGLARRSPWLTAALVLALTALAGLPPGVAGLVAKVVVLRAAVDGHLTWLAVVAAVNTVIGLAVYLRLAVQPFLAPLPDAGEEAPVSTDPAEAAGAATRARTALSLAGAVGVTALVTLALSVDPQPLLHAAGVAAR